MLFFGWFGGLVSLTIATYVRMLQNQEIPTLWKVVPPKVVFSWVMGKGVKST
jgi:hypothetical protein